MSDHSEYEYGEGRGHDAQPYGGPAGSGAPDQPYGGGTGSGGPPQYGRDPGAGYGDPYVPEPLPAGQPPLHDPGTPYGAPPPGDEWSGHAPTQDGPGYGAPAAGDGWGAAPPAAHPWTPSQQPAAYGRPDGPGPYDAAPDWSRQQAQPHAYASTDPRAYANPQAYPAGQQYPAGQPYPDPQPYPSGQPYPDLQAYPQPYTAQQPYPQAGPTPYADPQAGPPPGRPDGSPDGPHPHAAGIEHTAVLPVIGEEEQPPGGRRARRTGGTGQPRTGSPIIPPGIQPAGLTAVLGLLLAGGAALGKPGLAVFLVALQAVTAAGWFRLNGMWPARQGIVLAFLAGVTADVGLLVADGGHAPEVVVGTLGVWLLFVLVLQLRHHGSADERLSSLTATSASTLITVLAAGYLAAAVSDAGTDPVVVGALAVAAATVVRALLPGEAVSAAGALLVAALAGLGAGQGDGFGGGHGLLLGLACGACALIGLRVASYDFPSRFVHFTAGVALPLTAAAPVVYALGRALS